jgi:hypothetical protein
MVQAPSGTLTERYEHGTRLRKKASREMHADLRGPADRDARAILAATDRTRVPELVPIRYERMLTSPFAYLRGAAAVMAEDLRHQPMAGIPVQACGDCHLMNFGAFATPEQNIVFDINDFDETLPGADFTADLKRLVASVAVAGLTANLSKKRARAIAAATRMQVTSRELVVTNSDPPVVLDLVEEPFHQIARTIQVQAETNGIFAIALRRNISPCALLMTSALIQSAS